VNPERDRIIELARQGQTTADVHRQMKVIIAPGLLQDIFRVIRRKISSHEANDLVEMMHECPKFDTLILTDSANQFTSFYAARKEF
jgi:hypothetical protein